MFAGRLAVGVNVVDVARAAQAAPRPSDARRLPDLLLDWLMVHYSDGYVPAAPALRDLLTALDGEPSPDDELIWLLLASGATHYAWDDDRFEVVTTRHVELTRTRGALSDIPLALSSRATALMFFGDLAGVAAVVDELQAAHDATGSNLAPYAALGLAAMRGDHDKATALIEATVADVTARGEGNGLTFAWWAEAILHNGSGDYRQGARRRRARGTFPAGAGLGQLVTRRTRRGRGSKRSHRHRSRCRRATGRADHRQRHRLGVGPGGAVARSRSATARSPRGSTVSRSSVSGGPGRARNWRELTWCTGNGFAANAAAPPPAPSCARPTTCSRRWA